MATQDAQAWAASLPEKKLDRTHVLTLEKASVNKQMEVTEALLLFHGPPRKMKDGSNTWDASELQPTTHAVVAHLLS